VSYVQASHWAQGSSGEPAPPTDMEWPGFRTVPLKPPTGDNTDNALPTVALSPDVDRLLANSAYGQKNGGGIQRRLPVDGVGFQRPSDGRSCKWAGRPAAER